MNAALLRGLLYVAFFLSGVAGLVYEVVWSKYLTLFLGSTSFAHTVVLATFMGGLACGNAFLGRLADRTRMDKLRLYALLEVGVGLLCLLFPISFAALSDLYLAVGSRTGPGSPFNPVLKIAFSVLSIFLPCFLMGGTLPVLAKYAIDSLSGRGFRLSWLYFVNTAGGVAGCLLGGFYVIERLGLEFGVVGTSLVNSSIGGVFYLFYRLGYSHLVAQPALDAGVQASPARASGAEPEYTVTQARAAFWCIAVAGGLTMLYELCWIRLLVMSTGGTVHSFATMLAGFIFGIAVGSGLIGRALRRGRDALALFALCELGIACSVLVPLGLYERLPFWFFRVASGIVHEPEQYGVYLVSQVAFALLVMLVPTALMGAALPLATRVCVDRLESVARRVGSVFSVNTVGSVVGAAATGFVLLPRLGLEATLILGAVVSGLLGTLLLGAWRPRAAGSPLRALRDAFAGERGGAGAGFWPAALGVVLLLTALRLAYYPNWDARLMQTALYRWERRFNVATFEEFRRARARDKFIFVRDGSDASVAVEDHGVERDLRINGKPDASTGGDLLSQLMVGHIGLFLHSAPRRVMVVGLGSGATAGGVLRHPGVTADVAEISPEVVEAAAFFREINDGVLANPRMSLAVVDAREFMLLKRDLYDVIVSEPTNVWVPGVASLFTADFYRVVLAHLGPGGLFTQWIHLYSSDPHMVAGTVASLHRVFPWLSVWMAEETDLVFVAGREPPRFDPEAFARRIRGVRAAEGLPARSPHLRRLADPLLLLLSQVATDQGTRAIWPPGGGQPYGDLFPRMEFLAARAQFVGRSYDVYKDVDERFTPLGTEPLLVTEYLKQFPLSDAERARLRAGLLQDNGSYQRLGRALAVEDALRGSGDPLDVLPLPEESRARILLARSLEPLFAAGASVEVCAAYLQARGKAMEEASSVLSRPDERALTSRGEECIARHPEMSARWRLELAKLLAAAGARKEAFARLEALDTDGIVDAAKPAERSELAELGWRLALATGQPEKAARWDLRARALR